MMLLALLLACAPTPGVPATTAPEPSTTPGLSAAPAASPGLRLADVDFPGDPAVAALAREVLALVLEVHPALAADAGLLGDGLRLPTWSEAAVDSRLTRSRDLLQQLEGINESALPVDDRIDLTLLRSALQTLVHQLTVEQRWTHRPAEWLEPVGTLLIAHTASPAPVPGAVDTLAAGIPAMVDELQARVSAPTRRDLETAQGLIEGVISMLEAQPASAATAAAVAALRAQHARQAERLASQELPPFRMIGPEAYRWRLEHALLLPWSADELLARAEHDLERVDAELAQLEAELPPPPPPTEEEQALAEKLDQQGVLALYDRMVTESLERLQDMDVLTVPDDLPPLRARPTPDALIPLTGDGGSMNPVPLFGPTDGAWWNVEHVDPAMTAEARLGTVQTMRRWDTTWFGPYAVHEGVPGHHLQLAAARSNPRPVRKLLQSTPGVEGWGLYAEALFEQHGGFDHSKEGRRITLRSYRARIKRVVFDVKVETGVWTLQEAADWKWGAAPGEGRVGPELLRTVQWPTQLIGYYAGREELETLRIDCQAAWGADYSERRFHDAVLAAGPIPVSLVRLALLGD
jgi:hypothetical protein